MGNCLFCNEVEEERPRGRLGYSKRRPFERSPQTLPNYAVPWQNPTDMPYISPAERYAKKLKELQASKKLETKPTVVASRPTATRQSTLPPPVCNLVEPSPGYSSLSSSSTEENNDEEDDEEDDKEGDEEGDKEKKISPMSDVKKNVEQVNPSEQIQQLSFHQKRQPMSRRPVSRPQMSRQTQTPPKQISPPPPRQPFSRPKYSRQPDPYRKVPAPVQLPRIPTRFPSARSSSPDASQLRPARWGSNFHFNYNQPSQGLVNPTTTNASRSSTAGDLFATNTNNHRDHGNQTRQMSANNDEPSSNRSSNSSIQNCENNFFVPYYKQDNDSELEDGEDYEEVDEEEVEYEDNQDLNQTRLGANYRDNGNQPPNLANIRKRFNRYIWKSENLENNVQYGQLAKEWIDPELEDDDDYEEEEDQEEYEDNQDLNQPRFGSNYRDNGNQPRLDSNYRDNGNGPRLGSNYCVNGNGPRLGSNYRCNSNQPPEDTTTTTNEPTVASYLYETNTNNHRDQGNRYYSNRENRENNVQYGQWTKECADLELEDDDDDYEEEESEEEYEDIQSRPQNNPRTYKTRLGPEHQQFPMPSYYLFR